MPASYLIFKIFKKLELGVSNEIKYSHNTGSNDWYVSGYLILK
jgi:hypothetical protein